MHHLTWRAALAAVALAAAAAGPARADETAGATPEQGRKTYTSYCVRCHGLNLAVSGGGAFDLRRFPRDDKARFIESVTHGKRAMPAWGGVLKPADLDAIWAYIGSVNGWEASNQAQ